MTDSHFEGLEKLSEEIKAEKKRVEAIFNSTNPYRLFVFHAHYDPKEKRYNKVRTEQYIRESLEPIIDGEEFEIRDDLELVDFVRRHNPIPYNGSTVYAIDFQPHTFGPILECLKAISDRNRTNYRKRLNRAVMELSKLIDSEEE